jgi:hypothetical protein
VKIVARGLRGHRGEIPWEHAVNFVKLLSSPLPHHHHFHHHHHHLDIKIPSELTKNVTWSLFLNLV